MSAERNDTKRADNKSGSLIGDERWNLVLRVLESKEFSRAPKLREFLQYVCRTTLTDQTQDLHEQQIGCAVFGRRADYNPAEDNIVRVEARELRKRLDRYFARKGNAEPICISIPKGSYVPCFEANNRTLAPGKSAGAPDEGTELPPQTPAVIDKPNGTAKFPLRIWGIAGSLLLVIAILLGVHWASSRTGSRGSTVENFASKAGSAVGIWPLLFPVKSPLNIISADASLVLLQDISHKTVSLSYYLSGEYGKNLGHPVLQRIAPNPYIDLSDLRVTTKIMDAVRPLGLGITVQYPRYINLSDLDTKNLVFLGSEFSDPWIDEFHRHMNFVVWMDPTTRNLCFVNKKPKTGELERYCATGGPGQEDVTYGLVTFLPNLQHTGNVLILAGTTGAGTEAAGDFVTDPHYAPELLRFLGLNSKPASLPYFQILLETVVLNNNPGNLKVLTHRIIPDRSS